MIQTATRLPPALSKHTAHTIDAPSHTVISSLRLCSLLTEGLPRRPYFFVHERLNAFHEQAPIPVLGFFLVNIQS